MTTRPPDHESPIAIFSRHWRAILGMGMLAAMLAANFTTSHANALYAQNPNETEKQQPPSCTAQGFLRIAVHPIGKDNSPPVSMVIADPEGRRSGFDAIRKMEYSDVPEATYSGGPEQGDSTTTSGEFLEICNPIGGQYELRVIGTKPGKYAVSISAASREFVDASERLMSLDSRAELPPATARRGMTQTFLVVYSRTPGVKVRVKPAPQK